MACASRPAFPLGVGSNEPGDPSRPGFSPAFRALLIAEVRCRFTGRSQRVWPDPPLGFHPLQGSSSLRDGLASYELLLPWAWSGSAASRLPFPALRSLDRGEPRGSPRRSSPLLGFCTSSRRTGCRCRLGPSRGTSFPLQRLANKPVAVRSSRTASSRGLRTLQGVPRTTVPPLSVGRSLRPRPVKARRRSSGVRRRDVV
jgi:hypothetical protein